MNRKPLISLLAFVVLGASVNAWAADMPTLRYGGGGGGVTHLPLIIAQRHGFFDKEGVKVVMIDHSSPGPDSNSQAALKGYDPAIERTGLADMTGANGGFFIDAVLNGSNAIAVGVQMANPVHSLVVRKEIKSFADLKGKVITLTAPWDAITLTSRALLKLHGINRDDFKFEAIKMSVARLDCMKKGDCAAIAAVQPTDIDAINMGEGFHSLGTIAEAGRVTFYMDIVRRDWAAAHKDTVVRYLKAESDAMRYLHDPKNRDELTKLVAEETKEKPDVVAQMVKSFTDPKQRVYPEHGEFDMEGFNNLLRFAKESGNTDKPFPPAEKFVDLSYVKAAGAQ